MSMHLFLDDYVNGRIFDEEHDDYGKVVDEKTVVIAFCHEEIPYLSDDWTFQIQFTTCEGCKADYALSLLADLP